MAVTFLSALSLGAFLALCAVSVGYLYLRHGRDRANLLSVACYRDGRLANLVKLAAFRLDLPLQEVLIRPEAAPNAYAVGFGSKNWVVLHSPILDLCDDKEILFILGHEFGHVKRRHTGWLTISGHQGVPFAIPLLTHAIALVFNNWLLRAEYTADRAGLLACRHLPSAARALAKMHYWDAEVDFQDLMQRGENLLHDPIVKLAEYFGSHPYLHNRVRQLQDFQPALVREGLCDATGI